MLSWKSRYLLWSCIVSLLFISCSNNTTKSSTLKVNEVLVYPALIYSSSGQTLKFSSRIDGSNLNDYSVSWNIFGNNANTTINENGVLSIAKEETAHTIYAIATSNFDNEKIGYSTIYLVQDNAYDVPAYDECEYVVEVNLIGFSFWDGGWIAGIIYYNSNEHTRPTTDPILNLQLGEIDIPVSINWQEYQEFYFFSADGTQYYFVGQDIIIELTTSEGTTIWETNIPHKPQFITYNYGNYYHLNEDITIAWELSETSGYQQLNLTDIRYRMIVNLNLNNNVRELSIPANSHQLEGSVSFQEMTIQNIYYTIIDNIAFKIMQNDDRGYSTHDDL